MSVGADKIIAHIKQDAQVKSDEIISKATAESNKIIADGEIEALAQKDSIIEAANKQADMKYQQIISEAKVNSRRNELESREELIEKAFRIASEKIEKLASENSANYVEALKQMIIEASVEIGSNQLEIFVRADDIDNVKNMIDEISEAVSEQTGQETSFIIGAPVEVIGGAVVSTIDGDVEVKNTIEARMLRYRKYLRSEVAKKLFG